MPHTFKKYIEAAFIMNNEINNKIVDKIKQGYYSRKNSNKDVLSSIKILWMFKVLLIATTFLTALTIAQAAHAKNVTTFCDWMADEAISVAQNKQNGMPETALIEKVLEENSNYTDQVILIRIIDRVYNDKLNISPFEHALYEYEVCNALLTSLKHKIIN